MYRSVAIIGSFQKFYNDICGVITFFKNKGFHVTSPYLSKITNSREQFVIFEADDESMTNDEIQTDTLRKILNADVVYVYNEDWTHIENGAEVTERGYVGKTTCYEIGILMAKNVPIYYFQPPLDLPVPVSQEQIISPNEFTEKYFTNDLSFLLPNKDNPRDENALRAVFKPNTLLVCGSMVFYDAMKAIKKQLERIGVSTIIPEDESFLPKNMTEKQFDEFKRKVSREYMDKIRARGTRAILVLNETKRDVENYIGTNTLAEIAMAFSWNRRIFLLNDIYPPLQDELIAWDAVAIHQDLNIIKEFFYEKKLNVSEEYQQLSFDIV